jgi:hypothetical protein
MHPRINMKKIIISFGFSALRPEAAPIEATPLPSRPPPPLGVGRQIHGFCFAYLRADSIMGSKPLLFWGSKVP